MIPKYSDIKDLFKKGATIEAQEKIIKLRESALELQEENEELKQRIKGLEDSLKNKHKLTWEKPSYWLVSGSEKDGPFCQRCSDAKSKLIRLQGGKNDIWDCCECKSRFYGPTFKMPLPRNKNSDWVV